MLGFKGKLQNSYFHLSTCWCKRISPCGSLFPLSPIQILHSDPVQISPFYVISEFQKADSHPHQSFWTHILKNQLLVIPRRWCWSGGGKPEVSGSADPCPEPGLRRTGFNTAALDTLPEAQKKEANIFKVLYKRVYLILKKWFTIGLFNLVELEEKSCRVHFYWRIVDTQYYVGVRWLLCDLAFAYFKKWSHKSSDHLPPSSYYNIIDSVSFDWSI